MESGGRGKISMSHGVDYLTTIRDEGKEGNGYYEDSAF